MKLIPISKNVKKKSNLFQILVISFFVIGLMAMKGFKSTKVIDNKIYMLSAVMTLLVLIFILQKLIHGRPIYAVEKDTDEKLPSAVSYNRPDAYDIHLTFFICLVFSIVLGIYFAYHLIFSVNEPGFPKEEISRYFLTAFLGIPLCLFLHRREVRLKEYAKERALQDLIINESGITVSPFIRTRLPFTLSSKYEVLPWMEIHSLLVRALENRRYRIGFVMTFTLKSGRTVNIFRKYIQGFEHTLVNYVACNSSAEIVLCDKLDIEKKGTLKESLS